ncbi:Glyoxalase/Bleomycin resistance protein/Dioxygenase superfamily protein [compost metagenome]
MFVDDQDKALKFYTEILGFVKKHEIPLGKFKWLTVTEPDNDHVELLLEPNENPTASTYQQSLVQQNIPCTTFFVEDVDQEFDRLTKLGVNFTKTPTVMGPVKIAVFDDTCGNLIQITQV